MLVKNFIKVIILKHLTWNKKLFFKLYVLLYKFQKGKIEIPNLTGL